MTDAENFAELRRKCQQCEALAEAARDRGDFSGAKLHENKAFEYRNFEATMGKYLEEARHHFEPLRQALRSFV